MYIHMWQLRSELSFLSARWDRITQHLQGAHVKWEKIIKIKHNRNAQNIFVVHSKHFPIKTMHSWYFKLSTHQISCPLSFALSTNLCELKRGRERKYH